MTDIEKVIKGLEGIYQCISPVSHTCGDCPYQDNHVECRRRVVKDALALLKEQEAIPVDTKVIGTFGGDMEVYCCRDCRTILDPAFHYCPNCGRAVKWE